MAGFDGKVVAAAFNVAALPPGPLRIHEQVVADKQHGACGWPMSAHGADGTCPAPARQLCGSCDAGLPMACICVEPPPAQSCPACGGNGQYPLTVTEEGAPLSWRPCPHCRPTEADVKAHESAVERYGKDYF